MVAGALRGMGAVAAGLMIAMGLKLLPTLRRNPMGLALCGLLGLATIGAVAVLRFPLAWVVIGFGITGWSLARWRIAQKEGRK
jgi:chromate transporter